MSTRGVVGFVADGVWKVTYNHGDSYPEWLGMRVLEFCKSITDWDKVKENVRKVVLVDSRSVASEELQKRYTKFCNLGVSLQKADEWYCLLREAQGEKGLYAIANGELEHMIDSHEFMADSLFCEWGYVVDLDKMVLRVYKSADAPQVTNVLPPDIPHNNRYIDNCKEAWYPIKMLYAYDLFNLPKFMLGVTNEFKNQYQTL